MGGISSNVDVPKHAMTVRSDSKAYLEFEMFCKNGCFISEIKEITDLKPLLYLLQ